MLQEKTKKSYCRVTGIVANEAHVCVLLRRGPSKWTQMIKWNTNNDSFNNGEWFNGRVYENYLDISPDGKYVIYCIRPTNPILKLY